MITSLRENKITELILKAKSTYYHELINACLKNGKKLWELIRELARKTSLNCDKKTITYSKDIAVSFNDFFANISQFLTENMATDRQLSHDTLSELLQSKLSHETFFDIPPVTDDFVLKRLTSFEDGKAMRLDGISPKLLRIGATALAPGLTRILNLSLSTGIFPEKWKITKVVPIHKKGSLQDRGYFRPISILSTLSKLLEKHVHNAFYSFCEFSDVSQSIHKGGF